MDGRGAQSERRTDSHLMTKRRSILKYGNAGVVMGAGMLSPDWALSGSLSGPAEARFYYSMNGFI